MHYKIFEQLPGPGQHVRTKYINGKSEDDPTFVAFTSIFDKPIPDDGNISQFVDADTWFEIFKDCTVEDYLATLITVTAVLDKRNKNLAVPSTSGQEYRFPMSSALQTVVAVALLNAVQAKLKAAYEEFDDVGFLKKVACRMEYLWEGGITAQESDDSLHVSLTQTCPQSLRVGNDLHLRTISEKQVSDSTFWQHMYSFYQELDILMKARWKPHIDATPLITKEDFQFIFQHQVPNNRQIRENLIRIKGMLIVVKNVLVRGPVRPEDKRWEYLPTAQTHVRVLRLLPEKSHPDIDSEQLRRFEKIKQDVPRQPPAAQQFAIPPPPPPRQPVKSWADDVVEEVATTSQSKSSLKADVVQLSKRFKSGHEVESLTLEDKSEIANSMIEALMSLKQPISKEWSLKTLLSGLAIMEDHLDKTLDKTLKNKALDNRRECE